MDVLSRLILLFYLHSVFADYGGEVDDGLEPEYLVDSQFTRLKGFIPSAWLQYQFSSGFMSLFEAISFCDEHVECSSFSANVLESDGTEIAEPQFFFFDAAPSLQGINADPEWLTFIKTPAQHRLCCRSAWSADTLPFLELPDVAAELQRLGLTNPNLLLRSRGHPAHFADERVPSDEIAAQVAISTAQRDVWPRVECDLSREQFVEEYLRPRQPGMFLNCEKGWAANTAWAPEALAHLAPPDSHWRAEVSNSRGHLMDNEYALLAEAIVGNGTGERMYVFDTLERHPAVQGHFRAPEMFIRDDVYTWATRLGAEVPARYGPLRWLSFGARSTGTVLHVDPVSSDDWNTLLFGAKHWLFWEPRTYERYAFYGECDSLCSSYLPVETGADWQVTGGDAFYMGGGMRTLRFSRHPKLPAPHEVLQRPGETIYIPAGWMHGVFNYGAVTLAVTMGHGDAVNLAREPWVLDHVLEAWEAQPSSRPLNALLHRVYYAWLDREGRAAFRNGTALSPEMRSDERTLALQAFLARHTE